MKRFFDRIFPTIERQEGSSHAAGSTAAAPGRSCQECAAGASPDQDWCLECGSRIDDTSTRWHQPAAVMASVALIFLAGLVLALSEVAKDAEIAKAKTVRKMVAAVPTPIPDVPTPQGPAVPPPSVAPPKTSKNDTDDKGPPVATPSGAGAGAADTASPGAAPAPTPGAGTYVPPAETPTAAPVGEWPAGEEAWTVVLLNARDKDEAKEFARKANEKGVNAGILDGSKYEPYNSGWVVWAGLFKSEDKALEASEGYAKKGFEGDSIEKISKKTADKPAAKKPADKPADEG